MRPLINLHDGILPDSWPHQTAADNNLHSLTHAVGSSHTWAHSHSATGAARSLLTAVTDTWAHENWALQGCCLTQQWIFIGLFGGYLLLDLILWRFWVLMPFKMIAVFVHEMCHATACWLTCGSVEGVEVHTNEGGVCKYRGGWRYLITPAGYLGGAFWGAAFVAMSADQIASYVVAGLLILGMLVALIKSDNWALRFICLATIVVVGVFLGLDAGGVLHALKYVTLFLGVFIGAFSVYDIYDDTISRTVKESDAYACSEICPICPSVGWGVVWAVVALIFMAAGLYLALVILDYPRY